ncbi:bifunctional glutamate N-acetyltransferase/amino-acid acetyltransferase ArgJ [Aquisalimonas asiatica]|uniref:Arginine biosynthesis bifunctional protein ArgJ n=1 Tax=Aquisalimonas asiatica TaxID=406100 RepID=A0A1H8S789_9GAMM|nr:bifunctional glutamate N-acetyltransferase/amino-acid acetyltransferase ArgJ [Aquisalimonas asiatica]SEO74541.1 glutamate N-acetyltransferase [Aquisalimonas asiatica]
MAVGLPAQPAISPVAGVRLGVAAAGIKKPDHPDLVLMALDPGARVSAVFTRNRFCAAPVHVARHHLGVAEPRFLVINTGNANAGTGEPGMAAARATCEAVARHMDVADASVLPFSTGVIGEPLPVDRIIDAIPAAATALQSDGWLPAAAGILTTDTVPKGASRRVVLSGGEITISGMSKGAGMIRPDMATMLAFIATDADLSQAQLDDLLRGAVGNSFNRITVDGDTSTNDACVLIGTGASGIAPADGSDDLARLHQAMVSLCQELAQAIVRDGEGATRFITIDVGGARDEAEAEAVAFTIAQSPLVKTAFFAGDPNWGRILAAIGRAGVDDMDVDRVAIWLDDLCIAAHGGRAPDYSEAAAAERMAREEITIHVALGRGDADATVWTCDFSYEYVRINAEYRT